MHYVNGTVCTIITFTHIFKAESGPVVKTDLGYTKNDSSATKLLCI